MATETQHHSLPPRTLYIYNPLTASQDIRLLRIISSTTGLIEGELVHASLSSSSTTYEAISYCWGDPTPVAKLWVTNTAFIRINASAASIFRARMAAGATGYIWIDAICINQSDNPEKSRQVKMMRDIYTCASRVLVWLGDPTPERGDMALEFLQTLDETLLALERQAEKAGKCVDMADILSQPGCEHPSPKWEALAKLLNRPWFSRVWIIQEVVLTSHSTFQCGPTGAIDGEIVARLAYNFLRNNMIEFLSYDPGGHGTGWNDEPKGCVTISRIWLLKQERTAGRFTKLETVLRQNCRAEATDARDKVFGLLGLAEDAGDRELDPDYGLAVVDVYTNSTRHLMLRDQSLELLSMAGAGSPRTTPGLPSWVPDWAKFESGEVFGYVASFWHAAGDTSVSIRPGPDKTSIEIDGCIVGKVESVCDMMPVGVKAEMDPGGKKEKKILNEFLGWVERVREVLVPLERGDECGEEGNRDGDEIERASKVNEEEAFWRTLICNITEECRPAGPEYGEYFHAYLEFCMEQAQAGKEGEGEDTGDDRVAEEDEEEEEEEETKEAARAEEEEAEEDKEENQDDVQAKPQAPTKIPQPKVEQEQEEVEEKEDEGEATEPEPPTTNPGRDQFRRASDRWQDHRLFRTHTGQPGYGTRGLAPDDVICIFSGGRAPFILRPYPRLQRVTTTTTRGEEDKEGGGNNGDEQDKEEGRGNQDQERNDHVNHGDEEDYILIGACYIHGLMDGEALLGHHRGGVDGESWGEEERRRSLRRRTREKENIRRERPQRVHERVHTGDMHQLGLVEARLPWVGLHILLLECQRRHNVNILERIVNIFTEIPHIILSHDSYIATATMDMGNIELEPVLVELYCNILDLIYSLIGLPRLWIRQRRLFFPVRASVEEPLKIIRDLDARARTIEATLEEDTRRAQAEERDKAVRAEISAIKYDLEMLQTEMSDVRGMLKALLTFHGISPPVTSSEQLALERASNTNEQH